MGTRLRGLGGFRGVGSRVGSGVHALTLRLRLRLLLVQRGFNVAVWQSGATEVPGLFGLGRRPGEAVPCFWMLVRFGVSLFFALGFVTRCCFWPDLDGVVLFNVVVVVVDVVDDLPQFQSNCTSGGSGKRAASTSTGGRSVFGGAQQDIVLYRLMTRGQ